MCAVMKHSWLGRFTMPVSLLVIGMLMMLSLDLKLASCQSQGQQQVCPEQNEIAPCVCTVKKNGLDVLCETTDLVHITKSLSTLKGKSPIIFYLKLRHNNLPKLQGFVFLSLDIRHLTIHNSSLAAIEENALSSLGESDTANKYPSRSSNRLGMLSLAKIKLNLYQF